MNLFDGMHERLTHSLSRKIIDTHEFQRKIDRTRIPSSLKEHRENQDVDPTFLPLKHFGLLKLEMIGLSVSIKILRFLFNLKKKKY